jgi:hypothetical protein
MLYEENQKIFYMLLTKYNRLWNIPKYVLIAFLIGFSFTQFLAAIINAETFFFGIKFGGSLAYIHIFSNVVIGVASIYLILKHVWIGSILSAVLFGYMVVSVQYIQNSDGVMIPTVWWSAATVLSLVVFLQSFFTVKRK